MSNYVLPIETIFFCDLAKSGLIAAMLDSERATGLEQPASKPTDKEHAPAHTRVANPMPTTTPGAKE